jgi:hypothetical protein
MSERAKDPTRKPSARGGCVSASHTLLFEHDEERCSVCSELLEPEDEADGTRVRGAGLLVWARGEERRYEEPQLCPGCAAAIGVSALHRWEIEEDEG